MSNGDKASRTAAVMSTAAAIAAGLAWLRSGKAAQAAPGELQIPEELMQLVMAIATDVDHIDKTTLQNILDAIAGIRLNILVQGWPPNTEGSRAFAVLCVAAATPYRASDLVIPDGMSLAIKSSPLNAVGSLIFVAKTPAECTNPNSAWPLIPNESITYQVKNANAYHVSTNIAGSIAIFTAEQRS